MENKVLQGKYTIMARQMKNIFSWDKDRQAFFATVVIHFIFTRKKPFTVHILVLLGKGCQDTWRGREICWSGNYCFGQVQ